MMSFNNFTVAKPANIVAKIVTEADLFDAETGIGSFERAESGLTIVKTNFVLKSGELFENVGLGAEEKHYLELGRLQYAGLAPDSMFEVVEGVKFLPMMVRGGKIVRYFLAKDGIDHVGEPVIVRGSLRSIKDLGVNREALLADGTIKEIPTLQRRLLSGESFEGEPTNTYQAGFVALGSAMQIGFWQACSGQLWHFAKGDILAPEIGGVHFLSYAAHVAQNRTVVIQSADGESKSRAYAGAQPGKPNSHPHVWWNRKCEAAKLAGIELQDLTLALC